MDDYCDEYSNPPLNYHEASRHERTSPKAKPEEKRKWIYAQHGDGRVVRDKQYLLDNRGGFFDLIADPLQENDLADSSDPTVVAARERLGTIRGRMLSDAGPPFALYRKRTLQKSGK